MTVKIKRFNDLNRYAIEMMKKFVLGIVFLASSCLGQEETGNRIQKFSSDELRKDFELVASTLKEIHPGVYHFISEDSLNQLSEEYLAQLNHPLTEDEFHILVRRFVRVVGCGHVTARPSEDWYERRRLNPYLIPLNVYIINNELYVKDVLDTTVSVESGWKILSIDGVLSKELLTQLTDIHERDGFNKTFEIRKIEKSFQTYYLFLSGAKREFNVEFESFKKDTIFVKLEKARGRRTSDEIPFNFQDKVVSKSNEFGILAKDSMIGVLDLNSFDSKGYKKFYKKGFKLLETQGVENLVIDLRGNGGGYFPNGNQLLRYLLPDNFTTNFWTKKQKIKKSPHLSMDPGSRITRKLFNLMQDKDKTDPNRNYEIRYRKIKKNHYNGKVYLLTDGATFSMGSYVASKLKNSGNAIVLGEETGGGEAGFNAVLSWNLTLPSTKIRISIPNYHIDLQVNTELEGRGVMPNIPIHYTIEDKINHRDLEMEYIFNNLLLK